ncbi:MAG: tRNA (guanosine(37)-N1)-methyltransferase TrmD [Deltaproteobacteria bacterium RIFCSPLOWO2_02_FULL_53_8]|nr:MAG: tRNA (guanosine(37)-N1)-methyltransferase TrmD [Deltaproteobacteria bacterium RIFCSPLOWO2_02_FULL_53_8]
MKFDILTLFPGFFEGPIRESIIGRAAAKGIIEVNTHNIRDWAPGKHKVTDDSPYGGGAGMVMKVEPVALALEALLSKGDSQNKESTLVILPSPQGVPFTHAQAQRLTTAKRIVIVCGRYEGVDERIRGFVDMEVSVGDYVLTGGEIPALTIIDAVSRLLPGVLGEPESAINESFSNGLLEYPQYTRPEDYRGMVVPQELLSGNHAQIARWRREQSIIRTFKRRPELLDKAVLTPEERRLVERLKGNN